MLQTRELSPGIRLNCIRTDRFKHAVLSIHLLRPMARQEAALNALIPELLLRGCRQSPNIRAITARLDDLYGAALGAQIRRVGDYQTLGLSASFIDDRFALAGDEILGPMAEFLGQLLLCPVLEKGIFPSQTVACEKRNLISALEAQRNDKQAYASAQLLKQMCRGSSFAVPRLGEISDVRRITAQTAFDHYQKLLCQSPIEIFYVGGASIDQVAALMTPIFAGLEREVAILPPQTGLMPAKPSRRSQRQAVTQGKLALGFVTPITYADPRFAAMQLCNGIFGSGMISKLFTHVREERGLCYAIGSGYYGAKGLVTVHAGIDTGRFSEAKAAILEQLEACQQGDISQQELEAAREAVLSGLRAIYDSPSAMESFFSTTAISGLNRSPEAYAEEIRAVTVADVVEAARTVQFHSSFFLKGN